MRRKYQQNVRVGGGGGVKRRRMRGGGGGHVERRGRWKVEERVVDGMERIRRRGGWRRRCRKEKEEVGEKEEKKQDG